MPFYKTKLIHTQDGGLGRIAVKFEKKEDKESPISVTFARVHSTPEIETKSNLLYVHWKTLAKENMRLKDTTNGNQYLELELNGLKVSEVFAKINTSFTVNVDINSNDWEVVASSNSTATNSRPSSSITVSQARPAAVISSPQNAEAKAASSSNTAVGSSLSFLPEVVSQPINRWNLVATQWSLSKSLAAQSSIMSSSSAASNSTSSSNVTPTPGPGATSGQR